jgi:hypothetical protein
MSATKAKVERLLRLDRAGLREVEDGGDAGIVEGVETGEGLRDAIRPVLQARASEMRG